MKKLIAPIIVILIFSFLLGCVESSSSGGISSQVCGTHTETYTTSTKGCDSMNNCVCLHKSYGGLGACDSCQCTKEVSNC